MRRREFFITANYYLKIRKNWRESFFETEPVELFDYFFDLNQRRSVRRFRVGDVMFRDEF